jgi:hypothetical protein
VATELKPGDRVGDGDGSTGRVVAVEIERVYDSRGHLTKREQIYVDWGKRG